MIDPKTNGEEPANESAATQRNEATTPATPSGKGVKRCGLLQNAGGIAAAVAALSGASQKSAAASSLAPLGPTPGSPLPWHPGVSVNTLHANLASRNAHLRGQEAWMHSLWVGLNRPPTPAAWHSGNLCGVLTYLKAIGGIVV